MEVHGDVGVAMVVEEAEEGKNILTADVADE